MTIDIEYPEDIQAVVYDLDGTLVRLDVDWDEVAADVEAIYREAGVPVDGDGVWELMERAPEHGLEDAVEETIGAHERAGAPTSRRLALADDLVELDLPAAVVSLNCEEACRKALDEHGLSEYVETVIGRDTLDAHKPDPEPLLAAVEALGVEPMATLFVGDSESDEVTAEQAGARFSYVGDGPTRY